MASAIFQYDHLWKLVTTGGLDLDTSTLAVRLVTSSYVFDEDHTQWDNGANDSTDPSYNEVSSGDGYTTGGITLSGASSDADKVDYTDVTWSSLTKTFRGVVCVAVGTFGGVTNPVLWYMLPDSTPSDIVSNGSDYSIIWNATDGLFHRDAE
jgi:hypothetical protein